MTPTEKAIRDFCGHHADWWPSTTQVQEMLALAKPEQEPVAWSSYEYDGIHHKPVAWMDADGNVSDNNDHKCFPIPLYTVTHPTPPQRTWVGLTDREKSNLWLESRAAIQRFYTYATLLEAYLKEKNT